MTGFPQISRMYMGTAEVYTRGLGGQSGPAVSPGSSSEMEPQTDSDLGTSL